MVLKKIFFKHTCTKKNHAHDYCQKNYHTSDSVSGKKTKKHATWRKKYHEHTRSEEKNFLVQVRVLKICAIIKSPTTPPHPSKVKWSTLNCFCVALRLV